MFIEVQELLYKQLKVLARESKKDPSRLVELTDSMIKIVQQMTTSNMI